MAQPFINSTAAFQGRERQVVVPAGPGVMPDWDGDELRRAGLPVERLDGRTLLEAAQEIGLSEVRVSQLRQEAESRLRVMLQ